MTSILTIGEHTLWLGNLANAQNKKLLVKNNIMFVFTVAIG